MSWDINTEGPKELNPPQGLYLVEIIEGSDTRIDNGQEIPRTRQRDGCPQIMFKCQIHMDANGNKGFEGYSFNISVARDDKGFRILRNMIAALLGPQKGNISFTPSTFDGKMGWVSAHYRNGWMNCEHDTWQAKEKLQVSAAAVSSNPTASAASEGSGDSDLPF